MPSEKFIQPTDIDIFRKRMSARLEEIDPTILDAVISPADREKLRKDDPLKEGLAVYKALKLKYKDDTTPEGKLLFQKANEQFDQIAAITKHAISLKRDPDAKIKKEDKSVQPEPKVVTPVAPITPAVDPAEEERKKREAERIRLEEELKKAGSTKEILEAKEKMRLEEEKAERYELWLAAEFLEQNGVSEEEISKMTPGARIARAKKFGLEDTAKREAIAKEAGIRGKREILFAREYLSREHGFDEEALGKFGNAKELIAEAEKRAGGKKIADIASELGPIIDQERKEYKAASTSATTPEINRILREKESREKLNAMLDREDLEIITHDNPDLDANAAIYILKVLGGAKNKIGKTIPKGLKTNEPGILLDVGKSHDLLSLKDEQVEINHHHPDKWIKTSSAEIALETLKKLGRIEKIEPWMREFVKFVSDIDNMSYPRPAKGTEREWFTNTYPNTLLGMQHAMPVEVIVEFFKDKKNPYEPFTDAELQKKFKPIGGTKEQTLADMVAHTMKLAEYSIKSTEWHENRSIALGRKVYSNELGKVLYYEPAYSGVDAKGKPKETNDSKMPIKPAHVAYILGYDSFIRSELKDKKGYFISWPDRDLNPLRSRMEKKDPNALIVRGSMILNYPDKDRGTDGAHINEYQFLNYVGLSILNEEQTEISVEYQTRRIVNSQNNIKGKKYENKLNTAATIFNRYIDRVSENIALVEASIEKNKNDKKKAGQNAKLAEKLKVLRNEMALWQAKVAKIEELRGKPESEFKTLYDESKLSKKGTAGEEIEEEGDVVDEDETITGAPTITSKKTGPTTPGPKTPEKTPPSTPTPESSTKKIEHIETISDLEVLKARYIAIERQLAAPGPANIEDSRREYRELMTEHYNIWAQYQWIKKGNVGTAPTPLTFDELRPILQQEKGIASKVAVSNAAPTGSEASPSARTETKEEIVRQREAEFDEYYPDYLPDNIMFGIYSKDSRGNLTHGHVEIEMDGKEYDLEGLENHPKVKAKDAEALKLLGYLKRMQADIDEINGKYDAKAGKASPTSLLN